MTGVIDLIHDCRSNYFECVELLFRKENEEQQSNLGIVEQDFQDLRDVSGLSAWPNTPSRQSLRRVMSCALERMYSRQSAELIDCIHG
jgi:hypothetical protein